jgi:membrane-bound ClpP family serine protease
MHLTVDPLFILLALAALLPWAKISPALRALVFRGRLALLLARLQRKHRSTILVFTGPIERYLSFALVRDIRAAPIDRPLILVLDTTGGDVSAGLQILHALAAHRGRVVVRVPDECWSSGTVAALGADEIVLAPDANLGFCDPIFKGDPSLIHTGPVMTAAVRGEAIDIVRSKHAHRDLVRSLTAARQGPRRNTGRRARARRAAGDVGQRPLAAAVHRGGARPGAPGARRRRPGLVSGAPLRRLVQVAWLTSARLPP